MEGVTELRAVADDLEREQQDVKLSIKLLGMKRRARRRRGRGPRGADKNNFLVSQSTLRHLNHAVLNHPHT